jgi:hypothetical protein
MHPNSGIECLLMAVDQIEGTHTPVIENFIIHEITDVLKKWSFNEFNMQYQRYIVNCIRKIDRVIEIDKNFPDIFDPSFCSVCIQYANSYDRYDPNTDSFDQAFDVIKFVLFEKSIVLSLLWNDELKKIKDDYKANVALSKKSSRDTTNVRSHKKNRGQNCFTNICDKTQDIMDKTFRKHPDLRAHLVEIQRFDFGEHLPMCENVRWIIACIIIGHFHGIIINYRDFITQNQLRIPDLIVKITLKKYKFTEICLYYKDDIKNNKLKLIDETKIFLE